MLGINHIPGGGFQQASSAAAMPSRERFYVELKPGETTYISWKKLVKESQMVVGPDAPVGAHPALEARIAPEVVKEQDPLPPPLNRFSSVIERIEKLYQGDNSDNEPSSFLDGEVVQDDQYDTRDSFIDDTELDEYFEVENAKLKHTGFFINKGQLEQEMTLPSFKKRKRKDLKMFSSEHAGKECKKLKPGVRLKVAARGALKKSTAVETKVFPGPESERGRNIPMAVVDKELNGTRGNGMVLGVIDPISTDRLLVEGSSHAKARAGLIDINKPLEMDAFSMLSSQETGFTNGMKLKSVKRRLEEKPSKDSMQKLLLVTGKEISPGRPKGTALERALMDLENGVAELCPPSLVVRELDQNKRNRLPRDIKQKLAKVARLAAKQGKIADELVDRLMGILGHMMQVQTLKRHLKVMIEMGLSAMQEKAGRLQGIKDEVTEMIKSRVLHTQEAHLPDNWQSLGVSAQKRSGEGRYQWDHATEDKIYDLYEQYIEGMDENKGPQLRKLYTELAELWPDGWMDNTGIKCAVQRAKERKKQQSKAINSVNCKRRRGPMVKPKLEELSWDGVQPNMLMSHDQSPTGRASPCTNGLELAVHVEEQRQGPSKQDSTDIQSKNIKKNLFQEVSRELDKDGVATP